MPSLDMPSLDMPSTVTLRSAPVGETGPGRHRRRAAGRVAPRRARRLGLGVLVVAGAGLAASAVGALLRSRGGRLRPALRQTGRAARSARLAGLGARTGGTLAMHRARRIFASAERREALDAEFELRTAEQVAESLGHMKGALMKLGQMASYLDDALPEPFRDALAQLQADAPPMSAELAAAVVEEELGAPPQKIFAEWDPVPIAAASIGQVHRAITHEGVAAAVKVQYPGVSEAIAADLDNADLVFGALGLHFTGFEAGPMVEELRVRLNEELDYLHEARNQAEFARYYEGHPFIHVPSVLGAYSTARVLTTELAEGERFSVVEGWPDEERDLAGETIFRFVFAGIYRLRLFNGDPHPGNYLFRPGGRVTFLDFGLCKRFDDDDLVKMRDLIESIVVSPDPAAFRGAMERAGFLRRGAPVTDREVFDYFAHFYDLVRIDRDLTVGDEYATETVRRFFDSTTPEGQILKHTNVPPNFVVVQRINLGLYAVLARLRATANWHRIGLETWPWLDAPASTPLGEMEAAWRARVGRP